jgi:hypothetical protein
LMMLSVTEEPKSSVHAYVDRFQSFSFWLLWDYFDPSGCVERSANCFEREEAHLDHPRYQRSRKTRQVSKEYMISHFFCSVDWSSDYLEFVPSGCHCCLVPLDLEKLVFS